MSPRVRGRVPKLSKRKKSGPGPGGDMTVKKRMTLWDSLISKNLDVIKGWVRRGYTEESICRHFGISTVTFWQYKQDHPELNEAVEEGKRDACTLVENALFRECTGYEVKEVKSVERCDTDGNVIVSESHVSTKFQRPSSSCITFFLSNRDPERWQHVRKQLTEGKSTVLHVHGEARGVDLQKLNRNQLADLEGLLYRALGAEADLDGDNRMLTIDAEATVQDDDDLDFDWDDE